MKKTSPVVFIQTADWHIKSHYLYNDFSNRENAMIASIKKMIAAARQCKASRFIIAGDIFDNYNPSSKLLNLFIHYIYPLKRYGIKVISITGNHDTKYSKDDGLSASLSALDRVNDESWIKVVTNNTKMYEENIQGNIFVYVPWQKNLSSVISSITNKQDKCLFTHGLITGTISDAGSIAFRNAELDPAVLSEFKYVGIGDAHRPQWIRPDSYGKKILYSGTPIAFDWSDSGQKKMAAIGTVNSDGVRVQRLSLPDIDFIKIKISNLDMESVLASIQGRSLASSYVRIYYESGDIKNKLIIQTSLLDMGCYDVEFFSKSIGTAIKRSVNKTNLEFDALAYCLDSVGDDIKKSKYISKIHDKYISSREI